MATKSGLAQSPLILIGLATAISLALYSQQALLLLLKVSEVFGGVFDTSVPAFPLAGMLFVLMFVALRKEDFANLLESRERNNATAAAGVVMVALPMPVLLTAGASLSESYVFAAVALTVSWVGVLTAIRPSVLKFLLPYLTIYVAAIGSVSLLTSSVGDPLAVIVAAISSAITHLAGLPVQWSSVNIAFVAAGGTPVTLYISEECSGIASISIFLLVMGLMRLDVKTETRSTILIALGGAGLFVLLNALRVVVVVWGGIVGGTDLMWNLHGWVGYAFYILGYSLLVLIFLKSRNSKGVVKSASKESVEASPATQAKSSLAQ